MGYGNYLKALSQEIHPFLLSKVLPSPAGECSSPVLWLEIHRGVALVRAPLVQGRAGQQRWVTTSPALLNPTGLTWMEGTNEPPSACATARDQAQLYIPNISGKTPLWKMSQCNQTPLLKRIWGSSFTWPALTCEKLGWLGWSLQPIQICNSPASQAHIWAPGSLFLSVTDRDGCVLIICACKNPVFAESHKPLLFHSFIKL